MSFFLKKEKYKTKLMPIFEGYTIYMAFQIGPKVLNLEVGMYKGDSDVGRVLMEGGV